MIENTIWGLGGHSHGAPADTLPAYWGALGSGADGLAISVAITNDGALVCAPPMVHDGEGKEHRVRELTLERLQGIDIGAQFRSSQLSDDNQQVDSGDDAPWTGRSGHQGYESHPLLERVLLFFSRRTRLLLIVESTASEVIPALESMLRRFGVIDRVIIAGNHATLSFVEESSKLCVVHHESDPLAETIEHARRLKASIILSPESLPDEATSDVRFIVRPSEGYAVVSTEQFAALSNREDVAGWLATAVDRMHSLVYPRGLILEDDFDGPLDEELWASGHSRDNDDTTLTIDNGIHIEMEGDSYSGAAVYSEFAVHGDFDARMSFEVTNPARGATFELAVLQIDAGYHRPNLTFDVHGAPPYASSERDETDGFRIGWNNGSALTRWYREEARSENLYNNYSRDVGYGGSDSPAGQIRLVRSGEVFSAYYQDAANRGWVLSGSALVPALAQSVFFRLAAKHFRRLPPDYKVRMWGFRLFQW